MSLLFDLTLVPVIVFLLPGFAMLVGCYSRWRQIPIEVLLALAAGLSVAFYSLLFLFAKEFGIVISSSLLWVIYLAFLVWLLIARGKRFREWKHDYRSRLWQILKNGSLSAIGLLIVGAALLIVRFLAIRSLPLPMWGDSVHHTLIVQLLLENGGLFDSWQPYAEMQSMTYHFGFHATVAVYA